LTENLEFLCYDLLLSFMKLLELRNPFNIDHCKLVAQHCDKVAREAGLPNSDRERLVRAAEVHTLGVLLQMEEKQKDRYLPISRLGQRTGREVSIHHREEEIFDEVLRNIPQFHGCREILLQRHEWFDGTGSILGLSGLDICREARILAVADAYVDLVTPKAHRLPEKTEVALSRLEELAGLQFDPQYVEALKRALAGEDESERASRNQKFEEAHCRHYLGLGHFYTQIHETDWALRSYVAAERMAVRMNAHGLQQAAISGQFMVFCDLEQLERARETLHQVRDRGTTSRDKLGYQLLWGLLEWLSGNPLGKEILTRVIAQYTDNENLPGMTAALGFQACMTLFHKGAEDPEHLQYLEQFLALVDQHDVFDVVERYRPYTIPVFLNAVVQDVKSQLARNLLTKMGEPCHGPLHERLRKVHPSQWTKVLMPDSVLGSTDTVAPLEEQDTKLHIGTLGALTFDYLTQHFGVEQWQTQKTIKLFLRLALDSGRPLNTEMLAEDLWPDAGPQKARDSFRNCVHQVRRTLREIVGDEKAQVVGRSRKNKTVTLELPCRFDFQDFEETVAEAIGQYNSAQVEQARGLVSRALDIYHGPFLEGFDDPWIEAKRARLSAMRNQALTTLTRCQLALEEYDASEQSARELLEADDLREESHILLIESLGRSGRSAEAIAHYESAVDLFENEIGVAPDRLKEPLVELGLLL
jgi:DNA-binding SARP family transcriptional activator